MKIEIYNRVFNEIGIYYSFVNRDLEVHFFGNEIGQYLEIDTSKGKNNIFNIFPELEKNKENIEELFNGSSDKISLKAINRESGKGIIVYDLFLFSHEEDPSRLHLIVHDITSESQSCNAVIQSKNEITLLHEELIIKNKKMEELKEKAQRERDLLAKYFSRDLIDGILDGTISTTLGGEVRVASILFCDLRNSTTIAESIEPDLFMKLLNNLFTDLTDIIFGEGGSVNKFLGDGFLATFGCPKEIPDDALHCANVAVKIRKYLSNFNQFRPKYLADPISMGIGIARGKLFTGNFGSVNQIEYSVLGDPVNIASRLESLTKSADFDILLEDNILKELGDRIEVQEIKFSNIKGKMKKVKVYKLIDVK